MKNKYEFEKDYVKIYVTKEQKSFTEITYIDIEDFDKIDNYDVTWYLHPVSWDTEMDYVLCSQYMGKVDGKYKYQTFYLHSVIMNSNNGVDHLDHNPLNNRRNNLRVREGNSNSVNRLGPNKNNKSGYRNVCRVGNRWIVQLQINGKNTRLKSFPLSQLEDAGLLAKEMRQKYYGESGTLMERQHKN